MNSEDWIPTKERLPTEEGYYLVSQREIWDLKTQQLMGWGKFGPTRVFCCYFVRGEFRSPMTGDIPVYLKGIPIRTITAWQSLPEVYKEPNDD